MDKMTHVDSMMVIGTRLPVKENQYMHFEWGDYDNITGQYSDGYLYEWYHTLNELEDFGLYCEYITTPISTEDLLEENDNKKLLSEAEFNARKEVIKDHLNKQKQQLAKYEQSEIGKFLIDPEKYPFEQECIISGRLITKTYKTTQDRDKLLAGYNENKYEEIMSDIHKLQDEGGDENSFDISARQNLYVAKYLHSKLINGIKVNTENLNKLEVAQSSLFAIPAPSVPALAPNNGLNIGINQNSDHRIASGIEKTLGNIRDGLAETFDCSFGMSCSNDLDKAAKNPNVGTDLSNSEKAKLGGSTSGTPDGWEPKDEEHTRHKEQQQKNFEELTRVYDKDSPSQTITIDGQKIK